MGNDDFVREVVELDLILRSAFQERDFETLARLHASEFTLNGPDGRIQSLHKMLDAVGRSEGRQTGVERVVEAAYAVGDTVVIMGSESLIWQRTGSDRDGRRTARRFTNVWQRVDGEWRHIARQATTIHTHEPA